VTAEAQNTEAESISEENCPFVGSKNSDKFHIPDSAPAKRIKPENRVCFSSEEEALEEGYEPGTLE
jgi:methylphosphotriester-DNA--protein-cysteine methyltransferase